MRINGRFVLHLAFICAAACLWEGLVRKGVINGFYTASPSSILAALLDLLRDPSLPGHALKSVKNLLAGYALALVTGVGLGVAVGYYRPVYENLKAYVQVLYMIPRLVFIPFFIIWLGIGDLSKIGIVFLMTFFTFFIAAMEAAKNTRRDLSDVCRVYGSGRSLTLLYLVLPGAAGPIFTGAKLAVARGVAGMILSENFGRAEGLGYLMFRFGANYAVSSMIAAMLLIMALSMTLYSAVNFLEARFVKWPL